LKPLSLISELYRQKINIRSTYLEFENLMEIVVSGDGGGTPDAASYCDIGSGRYAN